MRKYIYYLTSIFTLLAGISNWPSVVATFLGWDTRSPKWIHLRRLRLDLVVRGKMDIWSVKEALLDRFYERYGSPIGKNWTVVDIGAGIGEFTLAAAANKPDNRVLAFEPFAESYDLLRQNILHNEILNVEAYPQAIWSKTGNLQLDLSGGEPLQLTTLDGDSGVDQPGMLVVPCCSLAEKLDVLGIEKVDLMKLDCEGAEFAILFNLPEKTLEGIRRIVMEYHDNVTPYTHQDMARYLEDQGYRVRIHPNPVHNYLGYLYAIR